MSTVRAVLFDFGNVLGTFSHRKATERLARTVGGTPSGVEDLLFGTDHLEVRETGRRSGAEFHAFVREFYGIDAVAFSFEDFSMLWGDIFTPAPPLIEELLDRLRRDVGAAIASNTEELHWRYIATLPTVTRFVGVSNRHVVASFRIGVRKPSRDFYRVACETLESDVAHTLLIDDRVENLDGFRACGGIAAQFDLTRHEPRVLEQILEHYNLLM